MIDSESQLSKDRKPIVHELKILPKYFKEVYEGRKVTISSLNFVEMTEITV